MPRTLTLLALVTALFLALPASASSNHYRWKDDQGKTVLSDRPPPAGISYEIVSSSSSYSRAVDANEGALKADETDPTASEQSALEKQAEQARQKAEMCTRAKSNLEALSGTAKVVVRTPEGTQRALTDEEIAQQRDTARTQVNAYCE
ncbi:MAG: DUF4124 domain-containing protein [Halioglobus sp.]|nr:DUF4124 domain-containing protein [Halioglobus sp.]